MSALPSAPAPQRAAESLADLAADARPLLPRRAARLVGFLALGAFGAAQWALLVEPKATGRLLGAVVAGALAGAALGPLVRASRGARLAGAAGGLAVAAGAALLLAGIPLRLLVPSGWGELSAGISQGFQALPDVRVPYAGVDPWPRLVIVAGGALVAAVAGVAALWPSRGPAAGGHGVALGLLTLLYAVPAIDITTEHQFLRGAAFAALIAVFLWLERVPRRSAPAAGVALAAALVLGLAGAPVLDGQRPWVDYERIAESFAPASGVRFDFDHSYGPIDWPRDGREVLRMKARRSTYWKARNLDDFDGRRWRASLATAGYSTPLAGELPEGLARRRGWRDRIEVAVRSLETRDLVAAGTVLDVIRPPSPPLPRTSPGSFAFEDPLERGDSYAAEVYVPRPSPAELGRAGSDYEGLGERYFALSLPLGSGASADVHFPPFGSGGRPVAWTYVGGVVDPDVEAELESSPYAGVYALARRMASRSRTPYEYVRRVLAHLADGYTYTEDPPPAAVPLRDFLLRDKAGYCQQFSGAMAMLLRMGGVPARVAGGFSPGSFSRKRKDWVVRDVDAHSWVEAWFPGYGWVTLDPTPAASPARSQQITVDLPDATAPPGLGGQASRGDVPEPNPRSRSGRDSGGPGESRATGAAILGGLGLVVLGAAALVLARTRRRVALRAADPELAELERALRRAGLDVAPGLTLRGLERRFAADPGAVAYLRAVASRRYGHGGDRPTPEQRRELRRALARGLGTGGRLRALWALPPDVRRALH